jgi:hypothetical protein
MFYDSADFAYTYSGKLCPVPQLIQSKSIRLILTLSFVFVSPLLLSSCSSLPSISDIWSDDSEEEVEAKAIKEAEEKVEGAKEKVEETKKADKEALAEETKEQVKEAKEEKEEDKRFAEMKEEIKKDEAKAAANPDQPASVTKMDFDKEMLAVNQSIHNLSERVEDISDRVHKLALRTEDLPTKLAELKLANTVNKEEALERARAARKNRDAKPAKKPVSLLKPAASMKKEPAVMTSSSKPFWGIQVGAYKTRAGAQSAWGEILTNATAIELNDAKVHYVPSKPTKDGRVLTLIILNRYANRKQARDACEGLKSKGVDCVARYARP